MLIIFGSTIACVRNLHEETELREYFGKKLRLDLFTSDYYLEKFQSYEEFRNKYKYVSVVFLRKGCKPCDLKIVDWHKSVEKIRDVNNYTVLFIVQGYSIDEIKQLKTSVNFDFSYIVDVNYRYLIYNKDIPYKILDKSILIDTENKIKLIGNPFKTTARHKQFQAIVKK